MSKVIFGMPSIYIPMELYEFLGSSSEAAIIQFIHESCESGESVLSYDGERWFTVTIDEMVESLPFSKSTIRRGLKRLEGVGYLLSDTLSTDYFDRTKSYRVDYEKLEEGLKEWRK